MGTTTNATTPRFRIRHANERGQTARGWLKSHHSFSFGDYFDPEHIGFRSLRVINDDWVAPGGGFPPHPHRDMEILSFVLSGQLEHQDSMGNGRTINAGELQIISAGRGITHSEFNPSPIAPTHFLQIWIVPSERGLTPSYADWKPSSTDKSNLQLLAQPALSAPHQEVSGSLLSNGRIAIHQDAWLYLGNLCEGESVEHFTHAERGLWIQVLDGVVEVGGEVLQPGDGLAIEDATSVKITARTTSRFLLFDLA